jgi:hypothetical protein
MGNPKIRPEKIGIEASKPEKLVFGGFLARIFWLFSKQA